MSGGDLTALGQIVSALGVPGLLALAIVAFWRGWVITQAHHEETCRRLGEARDFWRDQATAERAERQQATAQLAASTKSVDGLTAALADLRETVRDLGRARA